MIAEYVALYMSFSNSLAVSSDTLRQSLTINLVAVGLLSAPGRAGAPFSAFSTLGVDFPKSTL